MFGLLKSATKLAINTVTLSDSIVEDLITGKVIDEHNSTTRKLDSMDDETKRLVKEIEKILRG